MRSFREQPKAKPEVVASFDREAFERAIPLFVIDIVLALAGRFQTSRIELPKDMIDKQIFSARRRSVAKNDVAGR